MKIGSGQEFTPTILQPLFSFQPSTIWTMSVATTVVLVMLMRTIIAAINMHAEPKRMAVRKLFQDLLTIGIELFRTRMMEDFALQ